MGKNRNRRQDLDILRGLAVVGVVAYHYFPLRFSQGLNGVDVFLVISGYLVTQSLLELRPIRTPSLLKFYLRRLRRTVPALVATLSGCLILAFFSLNDYQLQQLARSSFHAITFQINFSLHFSIDYFNPDNRTNPLMHLWSLALEEQFYLVLPAVVWSLLKIRSVHKRLAVLMISTSVLVLSQFLTSQDSVFNSHYLPQARAWPLIIGVTIATGKFRFAGDSVRLIPQSLQSTFFHSLGIVLLVICAFTTFLPNDIRVQRIIFCALAALVVAYENPNAPGKWLGIDRLSYFGTRSYGLYLVHWPLLALTIGAVGREPTRAEKLALIGLSILLAEILHQLVEKPSLQKEFTRRFSIGLVSIHVLAGFATFGFTNTERFPNRPAMNGTRGAFLSHYQNLAANWYTSLEPRDFQRKHSCKVYLNQLIKESTSPESIINKCDLPAKDSRGVVWGDSFALALGFGIMQLELENESVFVMHADSCPPILKPGTIPNYETSECLKSNELAIALIKRISPSWILLSQRQAHEFNDWENLATWLRSLNRSMKIIVAGPVPQFEDDLPRTITTKYWLKFPHRLNIGEDVIKKHQTTDNFTQRQIKKLTDVSYVSIFGLFCDSNSCRYRLDGHEFGGLITWDSGHLTHYASKYVAQTLLKPLLQPGEE